MSTRHLFQLFAAIVLFSVALPSFHAQENKTTSAGSPEKNLHESLLGAWAQPSTIDDKGELIPGSGIKFFGLKHWTITQSDPKTGEMVHHHGGTYKLDGDTYEETVEFAGPSTKTFIGTTFNSRSLLTATRTNRLALATRSTKS